MRKGAIAIVLAAGEGTRMKSMLPKVLHKICARPMIDYILAILDEAGVKEKIVVVGYKKDEVAKYLNGRAKVVFQKKRLGTADAVRAAAREVGRSASTVLVLCADTPLLTSGTLKRLIAAHISGNADCTVLTANMKNPTGYGRIERDSKGRITGIVEEQEADVYEKAIEEVNVGAYCFKRDALFSNIGRIKQSDKKGEYYLTDIVAALSRGGSIINSVGVVDADEALGVNSREDLARAAHLLRERTISRLQEEGVTIIDPLTTYIDRDVRIGRDTTIYPMTTLEAGVSIGASCEIGPCARIRSGTVIGDNVIAGNFVEISRTRIGANTRVAHNCYLGDAEIGRDVNIGAGTITANYDGRDKYKTVIEDGAFIGSGTILIAPVRIGRRALTGAGAVLPKNKNVPAGALAVGVPARILKRRERQ